MSIYSFLLIIEAALQASHIKYAVYLVTLLYLAYLLGSDRSFVKNKNLYPFLFLTIIGIVFSPRANFLGINDLFILLMFFPFLFKKRGAEVNIVLVFCMAIGFWLLEIFFFGPDYLSINISESESNFESVFCFIFGFFSIIFLVQKRYYFLLLSLLVVFLSAKRIVFVALIFVTLCYFLPEKIRASILSRFSAILIVSLYIVFAVLLSASSVDSIIENYFQLDANAFTMGRKYLYYSVSQKIINSPFEFFFVGFGGGSSYLIDYGDMISANKLNLHSDILKISSEYGFLVLIVFIFLLIRRANLIQNLFQFYFLIILLTDNCLIYHFVIIYYCILIENFSNEKFKANR